MCCYIIVAKKKRGGGGRKEERNLLLSDVTTWFSRDRNTGNNFRGRSQSKHGGPCSVEVFLDLVLGFKTW